MSHSTTGVLALVTAIACLAGAGLLFATTQRTNPNGNWGLDRIDQRAGQDGQFSFTATGAGVSIYVVGTGVLATHQDFGGRASYVGDFCTGARRTGTTPVDPNSGYGGHETKVASYAAGAQSGVAKGATIYSLRTTWIPNETDPTNGGAACVTQGQHGAVAAAIDWIAANGVRPGVVNYSGGAGNADTQQAILNAIAAGFFVTLSGHTGGSVDSHWGSVVPTQALVVGATDSNDHALNAANDYGPDLGLYAPGSGDLRGASFSGNSVYDTPVDGGDSFAAPFVAGVAATYLQIHPTATPAEVRLAVIGAASPVSGLSKPLLYSIEAAHANRRALKGARK